MKAKKESKKLSFLFFQAMYEPVVFLKAVYRQLVFLSVMFVFGAGIFVYYENLPLLDAFLASVSTITTIGLYVPHGGNFVNLPRGEASLLIVLIILSVGAGASIVQSTVGAAVKSEMAKGEAEKKMISRLKGHAVLFGYAHLGRYVAEKFEELGMDYVVVTRDPHAYDELLRKGVLTVLEVESRPIDALREAGIERAAMVVASHEKDTDNVLIIISARKLKPDVRIVAVVHDPNLIETTKIAGADVTIPSSVTLGHLLAISAVTKDLVGVVFSEKMGTKEIAQFSVFKASPLIGKSMQQVAKLALVIGVIRGQSVLQDVFDPAFRIREGD
ncbi:MAG: NAD-binding protein, partial [Thaumarchaeota archaeon]|nr:NAD-binding protein [Nitrososphaerota archaeon]